MNIFVLDTNPLLAAQMMCDKHVVKMILESAQLLCSAFEPGTAPYKRTHYNHPCAVWIRQSKANYQWLIDHVVALNDEYKHRYGKSTNHKSMEAVAWCVTNIDKLSFPTNSPTAFVNCVSDELKLLPTVEAYRQYYKLYKGNILKYSNREVPNWIR